MAAHLRIYSDQEIPEPRETVGVSLGDLLPLVALAQRKNYAWLHDFLDDEVQISTDLHEVLQLFRCRPSA